MTPGTALPSPLLGLAPREVLALTIFHEGQARLVKGVGWVANPPEATLNIGNVIWNRLQDPRWAHLGIAGICQQHATTAAGRVVYQFSCWQPDAGPDHDGNHLADNYDALLHDAQALVSHGPIPGLLEHCVAQAEALLSRGVIDTLGGATHYYADWIAAPAWARPPAVETAFEYGHHFLRNVR